MAFTLDNLALHSYFRSRPYIPWNFESYFTPIRENPTENNAFFKKLNILIMDLWFQFKVLY